MRRIWHRLFGHKPYNYGFGYHCACGGIPYVSGEAGLDYKHLLPYSQRLGR